MLNPDRKQDFASSQDQRAVVWFKIKWTHGDRTREKKVFSYGEGGAVSAEDGPVKGSDAVPGPEVQVSSSIAKNFNQLAALL